MNAYNITQKIYLSLESHAESKRKVVMQLDFLLVYRSTNGLVRQLFYWICERAWKIRMQTTLESLCLTCFLMYMEGERIGAHNYLISLYWGFTCPITDFWTNLRQYWWKFWKSVFFIMHTPIPAMTTLIVCPHGKHLNTSPYQLRCKL